jgi:hypothetical protein
VDLRTMRSLIPSNGDPRNSDGAGPLTSVADYTEKRTTAPPNYFGRFARKYVERVLANELSALCEFAGRMAAGATHHAVVAVDWYRDRSTDTHNLHKDTTGSTLFVALHYANQAPILGAEYIFDRWKMPHVAVPTLDEGTWTRSNAPWAPTTGGWPASLCAELETARDHISSQITGAGDVHCAPLGPFGLLSFVDELIWHATPIEGSRSRLPNLGDGEYKKVSIQGITKRLPGNGQRLQRQVSRSSLLDFPVRDMGKRRFLRLWICVQPRSWTIPI